MSIGFDTHTDITQPPSPPDSIARFVRGHRGLSGGGNALHLVDKDAHQDGGVLGHLGDVLEELHHLHMSYGMSVPRL